MSYQTEYPARSLAAFAALQASVGVGRRVYNLKPSNTRKSRRGIGRVLSGQGRFTTAFVGDSNTAGVGDDGTATGVISQAFPAHLVARLNAVGVPAEDSAMFADHGFTTKANLLAYDARISLGASWDVTSLKTVGGRLLQHTGAGTDAANFTPDKAFDTIETIYYRGTNGQFGIGIDGGAAIATINSSGAGAILKSTQTCALDTHTVNITPVGDGPVQLIGIRTYDSTTPHVSVINLGWGGSKAGDWAATGGLAPLTGLGVIAPDDIHICLGANDWINGTNPATFRTDYQTVITAAMAIGDVKLYLPVPTNPASTPYATQQVYLDIIADLAAANDLPLIDANSRVGDWTTANGLGLYYDNWHIKAPAHVDLALMVAKTFSL